MADTTKALELRNAAKKKKYTFIVKESKFSSGVKKRWRFPRGKHSQVRQMHKGKPAMPKPGYGSPASVRGLDKNGLRRVKVSCLHDLEGLDSTKDGAVLSRTLGNRKSIAVMQKAQEQKIRVLNVADIQIKIKSINDALQARKKKRLEHKNKKTKKKDTTKEAKKETKKDTLKEDVKKSTSNVDKKPTVEKLVETETVTKVVTEKPVEPALADNKTEAKTQESK
jgi:large subunit ribosomal protein L32e